MTECQCHMYMKDNDKNLTFPDCQVHGKGGLIPACVRQQDKVELKQHAGRWHYESCAFPDVDHAVCNCPATLRPFTIKPRERPICQSCGGTGFICDSHSMNKYPCPGCRSPYCERPKCGPIDGTFIDDIRKAWHIQQELELCSGEEEHDDCITLLKVVRRSIAFGLSTALGAGKKARHKENPNHTPDEIYCCIECVEDEHFNKGLSSKNSSITKLLKRLESSEEKSV